MVDPHDTKEHGRLEGIELLTHQSLAELASSPIHDRAHENTGDRKSRQTVFQALIIDAHRSNEADQ